MIRIVVVVDVGVADVMDAGSVGVVAGDARYA